MKKDSVIDYFSCIIIKALGPVIRLLPLEAALFLGRRWGDFLYCFDLKHRSLAYANIKAAFQGRLSPAQISSITHRFYRAMGQNLIEMFFIPLMDERYINKYIHLQGLQHIDEGFKKKKGVILLSMHAGSWELSNAISAQLKFPFRLFVGQQRYLRLNELLNSYRSHRGCRIIQRDGQLRHLIKALQDNQAIGMTADQGGRFGTAVNFFGKDASMSSGAVRLALQYDAALVPVFCTRRKGPHLEFFIQPAFELKRTGHQQRDVRENLQEIIRIFEGFIWKYPQEYLWTYKIWKYSREKNILLLSDGKAGHLRQLQAVAQLLRERLSNSNIRAHLDIVEVRFRSRVDQHRLTFCSILAGKYCCQGCLRCLKKFLDTHTHCSLMERKPDIIVSCGASTAAINYILSRENLAQSIAILHPAILSTRRFNLVILPQHDRPVKRKNIAVTEAALNLIDAQYLKGQAEQLSRCALMDCGGRDFCIGALIGGDTRSFSLQKEMMEEVLHQIKSAAEKINADILLTTSRRTPEEIEGLLKARLQDDARCRLLVIANEKNIPFAVGGILGLSKIVVVSPESISMISEAASSSCYVVVFQGRLGLRHSRFLDYMAQKKYIYLCEPAQLATVIENLWEQKPPRQVLQDRDKIRLALERVMG